MKYYLKDQDETIEDAREVPECSETDPQWFAEEAAEHFFQYHDGWDASWPQTITVVGDEGEEHEFEVALDMSPVFHASPQKEQKEKKTTSNTHG